MQSRTPAPSGWSSVAWCALLVKLLPLNYIKAEATMLPPNNFEERFSGCVLLQEAHRSMQSRTPAPSGRGSVMWCASQVKLPPLNSASTGAPRARACSSSSSTSVPAQHNTEKVSSENQQRLVSMCAWTCCLLQGCWLGKADIAIKLTLLHVRSSMLHL